MLIIQVSDSQQWFPRLNSEINVRSTCDNSPIQLVIDSSLPDFYVGDYCRIQVHSLAWLILSS